MVGLDVPRWRGLLLLGALGVVACGSTTDSIGHDDLPSTTPPPPPSAVLLPLTGPDEYPSPFRDDLGKTSDAINKKVNAAFNQLFHGDDPDNQAIYFTMGDDEALIRDIYHDDVRTEGMGLGMLITVQLGKQDEFDKLWTYTKRELRYNSGSDEGYFRSRCDTSMGSTSCVDPYGAEQFAMTLIFAHDVWGDAGRIDYQADALDILDVMQHKEQQNGGIVDDVTNSFDSETHLPFDVPSTVAASFTRPSVLMPAYYALWAEATGDSFWSLAAEAARGFFPTVADTSTGLMPLRAYFDGTPVPGADAFTQDGYRTFLNLVLDEIWLRGNPSGPPECDKVLQFFSAQGIDKYVGGYQLDGTPTSSIHEPALVATNGVTALVSKNADRKAYIQAVWDQAIPTGQNRYYTGILQLFSLLVLSGKMQVL